MIQASKLRDQETNAPRSSLIQRLRVPLGFAFGFLFILLAEPTTLTVSAGTAVAIPGLLLRVWAAGHLQKHHRLTLSGPYRRTRNPLYLGSFIMGLGLCIASGRLLILLLFIVLFLLIYQPVMRKEETELRLTYGKDYEEYLRTVPLFFPLPARSTLPSYGNFSVRQIILNREYKAVIGFIAIIVFLIARVIWW